MVQALCGKLGLIPFPKEFVRPKICPEMPDQVVARVGHESESDLQE